jgi:hypothetical protein
MDKEREKTIGQFISTIIMSAILGIIAGVIWKFALNVELTQSLFYGGITGGIIGLLFALSNNRSIKSGRFQHKEASFASGGLMFGFFLFAVFVAIIVGLIRWIF